MADNNNNAADGYDDMNFVLGEGNGGIMGGMIGTWSDKTTLLIGWNL